MLVVAWSLFHMRYGIRNGVADTVSDLNKLSKAEGKEKF